MRSPSGHRRRPTGGIVVAHRVAVRSGLVSGIDQRLRVLKTHRPYHEPDHVLNIAYSSMCGGYTLDDIELRRNDQAFLDALGAMSIPDPTTAGDFCRRFSAYDVTAAQTPAARRHRPASPGVSPRMRLRSGDAGSARREFAGAPPPAETDLPPHAAPRREPAIACWQ